MRKIRVAAVQFQHKNGDKHANLETIRRFVDQAAEQGVEIILFPECCITGYWWLRNLSREQLAKLAEPVFDGPSSQELLGLAGEKEMTISAGLVEITDDGLLYNTQVVAMPDGNAARHRKLHCFVNKEMASGSEYTVFDTPHGCRVGLLTCYDNNIIENARMTALLDAEILLAPHQTGGCETGDPNVMGVINRRLWDERKTNPEAIETEFRGDKGRAWLMRWLPSRAHDNGIFLVFSNGVGVDDNEVRTGNAMILDTFGRVLAETWKARDEMVTAELDPTLRETNSGRRWILSRRPDLYAPIAQATGKEQETRSVRFFYEQKNTAGSDSSAEQEQVS